MSVNTPDGPPPFRHAAAVRIAPLQPRDHDAWLALARGYKAFYATATGDDEFETAWQRLLAEDGVHGLGAFVDGELAGVAHYLFHTSVWARTACYLQDLFTRPEARGRGVGRALVEAVAAAAQARGASRYYWNTQADNATARRLYDQVARHVGFIRYDYAWPAPAG